MHPARSYQDKNLEYSNTLIRNTTAIIKEVSTTMPNFVLLWSCRVIPCTCSVSSACKLRTLKIPAKQPNKHPAFSLNILELQCQRDEMPIFSSSFYSSKFKFSSSAYTFKRYNNLNISVIKTFNNRFFSSQFLSQCSQCITKQLQQQQLT